MGPWNIRRRELLSVLLTSWPGLAEFGRAPSLADLQSSGPIVNIRSGGARGDGTTDDRAAIQAMIDRLADEGGGVVLVPAGRFLLSSALIPRSGIIVLGLDRDRSILQAAPGSADNVIGIDYLVEGQMEAARHGKSLNRLSSRTFGTVSDQEARSTGGYAGYGVTDFHLRNLTIDGNKSQCPENGNLLATTHLGGRFAPGDTIRSTSGGWAMVSAVFAAGSPPGVSIRPSTIGGTGKFGVGDEIVGPSGRFILAERRGDDAYQAGVVFHAATRCSMRGCTIRNTVFQAVVVYNGCNLIELSNNSIIDPNLAGTRYTGGNVHIYCDFDNAGIRILDNTLRGGGGYGIVVSETGGRTERVTIAGNLILDTPGDGVRVASESTASAAMIAGIDISSNYIRHCGDTAIRLVHNGREGGISGPTVTGNRIEDARFGILISGRVNDPRVTGNRFHRIHGVALDLGSGPIDPRLM